MNRAVLVTGASGFIGRALCRHLVAAGATVKGTIRSKDRIPALEYGVAPIVTGDLSTEGDWLPMLSGVHVVVHLAARVHRMDESPSVAKEHYLRENRWVTSALATAAAQAGVARFIFLSSIKVNGEGGPVPYRETDPPRPSGPYAESKLLAEGDLQALAQNSSMEWVVLRPPLVYGPGVGANFLKLMEWVHRGVPLPIRSVRNRRSLISVGNLVNAIQLTMEHPQAANQVFLVCDRAAVSVAELVRKLASHMNRSPRLWPFPLWGLKFLGKLFGKTAALDRLTGSLIIDAAKITDQLTWRPPETLDQGIEATVNWYIGGR